MAEGTRDHTAIVVFVRMSSEVSRITPHISVRCSVFEVPYILRRYVIENERAYDPYEPRVFSIGPLHHGREVLEAAENIKLQYLQNLISRVEEAGGQRGSLNDWIKGILDVEEAARACYAVRIDLSSEEFVRMLVLDGCFIIELLCKKADLARVSNGAADPIFSLRYMLQFAERDLILLENQMPWLVLERLFNITVGLGLMIKACHWLNLVRKAFVSWPSGDRDDRQRRVEENNYDISGLGGRIDSRWQPIPSATTLVKAGIKFQTGGVITFRKGVLEMPPLLIDETTETVFRNLISFEQCFPDCSPAFSSYALLLGSLIKNTDDLETLSKTGIVYSLLNDKAATLFFDRIGRDVYVELDRFYYLLLCRDVFFYCQRRWPRWRAAYFRVCVTPWGIVTQAIGIIGLLLAFLQTVYTIKKGD